MAIPEERNTCIIDINEFITGIIIGSTQKDKRLCFILGSGASVSSKIPSGGELEMQWMNEIMVEEKAGELKEVRQKAAELYTENKIDHYFPEIEQAWEKAKKHKKKGKGLPSEYYFDIFVIRFYKNSGEGIKALQEVMRGREPGLGYYLLSRLLTENSCRNNVVITTNFDSLVEKAVFAYTQQAPVAVSHESLLTAMDWKVPYPIIAKVHRDLMFSPLNITQELKQLKEDWKEPLQGVLNQYIPIVIGYEGADQSLMSFLEDDSTSFPNGLYWCYWEKGGEPQKRIIDLVNKKSGFLVPIPGFDELMVRILMHQSRNGTVAQSKNLLNTARSALKGLKQRYIKKVDKFNEELEKIAKEIRDILPSTPWDYFSLAIRSNEAGKPDEAIGFLDKAIELKPDFAPFFIIRALAYEKLGNYDAAIADYNEVIKLDSNDAFSYYNRGNAYAMLGGYDAAIRDYDKAIELQPDDADAYNNRGNAYSVLGDYDAAIKNYDKALELDPDDAKAYNNRGVAYDDLGDYDAAIENYDKALELKPDYAEAYVNRGNAYSDLGDYDAAIENYNKVLELKPDYAEAYNNRGVAYAKSGDYKAAIKDYDKALELDPNLAEAYYNRGNAYSDLGDYHAAIKDFNRALELDPNYAKAYNNRGAAYSDLGDYDAAIKDYNKALELKPNLAEAYNNRGNAYSDLGDYGKAIKDFNKALELQPDYADPYNNRGEVYVKQGKPEVAIADLNKAIALDPDLADAYYNRSLAYRALGQLDKAEADRKKALALDPRYKDR